MLFKKNYTKVCLCILVVLTVGNLAFSQQIKRKSGSDFFSVRVGAITYSYRSMKGSLEQLITQVVNSGISDVELMGDPVEQYLGCPKDKSKIAEWRAAMPIRRYKDVRKMFDHAGIRIYAFKPNALNPQNTDEEIEYALKAAKALGARSVTVELPADPRHSQRLGKLAEKHKIYIGYHNHLQGNDVAWKVALSQSPYNSINLDCGHYIAAGGKNTKESLLAFIEANHQRITSMHIKDKRSKEKGGENRPWGEGDTPLAAIFQLLKDKRFDIPVSIELEYAIPAGSDAVQEVAKCLAYSKNILSPQ